MEITSWYSRAQLRLPNGAAGADLTYTLTKSRVPGSLECVGQAFFSRLIQRISRQKPQLFNNECVDSLSQAKIVLPNLAHRRYQRKTI